MLLSFFGDGFRRLLIKLLDDFLILFLDAICSLGHLLRSVLNARLDIHQILRLLFIAEITVSHEDDGKEEAQRHGVQAGVYGHIV